MANMQGMCHTCRQMVSTLVISVVCPSSIIHTPINIPKLGHRIRNSPHVPSTPTPIRFSNTNTPIPDTRPPSILIGHTKAKDRQTGWQIRLLQIRMRTQSRPIWNQRCKTSGNDPHSELPVHPLQGHIVPVPKAIT